MSYHFVSFHRRFFATVGCTDELVPTNALWLAWCVADWLQSWLASPRYDVANPADPWSSTVSHSFRKAGHHAGFSVVVWYSHHMPEMSQLSRFNMTSTFRSMHLVNLLCIKRWCASDVWRMTSLTTTSVCHVYRASVENRGLGRLKLAQRSPTSHVTRTPLSWSKGQRSTCKGRRHIVAASRTACSVVTAALSMEFWATFGCFYFQKPECASPLHSSNVHASHPFCHDGFVNPSLVMVFTDLFFHIFVNLTINTARTMAVLRFTSQSALFVTLLLKSAFAPISLHLPWCQVLLQQCSS